VGAEYFCSFVGETGKSKLHDSKCLLPPSESFGLKSLRLSAGLSQVTIAMKVFVATFDYSTSIETIPRYLETHKTGQLLEIDFGQTFQGL